MSSDLTYLAAYAQKCVDNPELSDIERALWSQIVGEIADYLDKPKPPAEAGLFDD